MSRQPSLLLRLGLCLLITAAGAAGFVMLKKMKKPPRLVEAAERPLAVQARQVRAVQVPVVVTGLGEVRSRRVVPLSAEVAGRVTSVHDNLQVGTVVEKGAVLCRINDQDYRIELEAAEARVKSLSRDLELARKELARVSGLYAKKKVGTLSSVEKAERAVNGIVNQLAQVRQARDMARLHLERCVVRAPFTGRISELQVQRDEYVAPGRKLFTLVDDADLEVEVSLDSRDAVRWLRFRPAGDNSGWFGLPEEASCSVTWTEDENVRGSGSLDRVVRFDPTTRTLVVAVRLARGQDAAFPLVAGMFCRVTIQGAPLDRVFVLPRQAVSFEGIVYVVRNGRLHSRRVEVAREQDSRVLVTGGLEDGETVILTRLENPLENTLVRVEESGNGAQ
jgi:RND family efflux transporter MFP subunit